MKKIFVIIFVSSSLLAMEPRTLLQPPLEGNGALSGLPPIGRTWQLLQQNALVDAAGRGDLGEVRSLVDTKKYDPNLKDDRGNTALIYAASRGHSDMVKFLLAHKADPNAKDFGECSALICAACQGQKDVVEILLPVTNIEDCGQDANYKTAIRVATTFEFNEIVDLLLKAEKDVRLKKLVDRLNAMGDNPIITKWRAWKSKQC